MKGIVTDSPPGIVDADLHSALSCACLQVVTSSLQPELPITTVPIGSRDSYVCVTKIPEMTAQK